MIGQRSRPIQEGRVESKPVKVVKAVKFAYEPTPELLSLMDTFRLMVNEAIRVGENEGVTSKYGIQKLVYGDFKKYSLHSHYTHGACECASSLLKNKKRKKKPYVWKPLLKLDNQIFRLEDDTLRIPVKPRQFIHIPLEIGEYQRSLLSDPSIKLGSLTITPKGVILAVSKTLGFFEPEGIMGIDVNEASVDCAIVKDDTLSFRSYDLSEAKTLKHTYYAKRRKIQEKFSRDRRKLKKILSKYNRNEQNRTKAILHRVANQIVDEAKEKRLGIVMEDLTDIRKSVNKKRMGINSFNGKRQRISVRTKSMKRRLNTWSFRRLQDFIEYKAKWQGIPVFYVDPKYTSRECPVCGEWVKKDGQESVCEQCGLRMDRHLLAGLNILKRKDGSLRFGLDSPVNVAVIRYFPLSKAVSRSKEVQHWRHPKSEQNLYTKTKLGEPP